MEIAMHPAPELLHDDDQRTAAPAMPDTSVFGDIPSSIWTAFLSAWALLFALFLVFFTRDGQSTLAVMTSSFFALMLLGLPAALGAQAKPARRARSRVILTHNGPVPITAAATQILLIPAASVIGVTALILLAL
ncbi:MAG TPA: hypothetical protein VFK28_04225 [Sphingomicrobium sp.]|jgi:hypothetical protein|nr:hypothetical protein [Sphingomicrobium sp.]